MHAVKFTGEKKVQALCIEISKKCQEGDKTLVQHNTVKSQQKMTQLLQMLAGLVISL